MFNWFKKTLNTQGNGAVRQGQGFDASQKNIYNGTSFESSLTPEEKRKRIEKAAQVTVEKYGPIIERLSKE